MNLLALFKDSDTIKEYAAGATIFTEGDPGDEMYVVLDGEIEIQIGKDLLKFAGPGHLFGEMALIEGSARSATAVAKSDCRLAAIDEKRFLFLVQQTPFFSLHVMRTLVDKLRKMNI